MKKVDFVCLNEVSVAREVENEFGGEGVFVLKKRRVENRAIFQKSVWPSDLLQLKAQN